MTKNSTSWVMCQEYDYNFWILKKTKTHMLYLIDCLRPLIECLASVFIKGLAELLILCTCLISRADVRQEVSAIQNLVKRIGKN